MPLVRKYEVIFFTTTVLNWKFLLTDDRYKEIITGSLKYLVDNGRVTLYAYAIMNNHLHVLWHIRWPHKREDVQRDFLKFTAQMIIMDLKACNPELLKEFYVGAKDRVHQIWERNPLSVHIWSEEVLKQKLDYIHNNPVKANLCSLPEEYKYSSAAFYREGLDTPGFLTSCFM
jgi:putative transposase